MIEALLSGNSDDFASLAQQIERLTGGKYTKKLDGPDQSYWELDVDGVLLTVHREHYLGVIVLSNSEKAGPIVKRIQDQLARK